MIQAIFRNQTPCSIAASLESACGARELRIHWSTLSTKLMVSTAHQVNQIPAETHYIGPSLSDADPCTCNSVTYSLVEACGGCQARSFILPFAQWKVNCTQAQVGSIGESVFDVTFLPSRPLTLARRTPRFPSLLLPPGVEIPSWAKLNISEVSWLTLRIFEEAHQIHKAFDPDAARGEFVFLDESIYR